MHLLSQPSTDEDRDGDRDEQLDDHALVDAGGEDEETAAADLLETTRICTILGFEVGDERSVYCVPRRLLRPMVSTRAFLPLTAGLHNYGHGGYHNDTFLGPMLPPTQFVDFEINYRNVAFHEIPFNTTRRKERMYYIRNHSRPDGHRVPRATCCICKELFGSRTRAVYFVDYRRFAPLVDFPCHLECAACWIWANRQDDRLHLGGYVLHNTPEYICCGMFDVFIRLNVIRYEGQMFCDYRSMGLFEGLLPQSNACLSEEYFMLHGVAIRTARIRLDWFHTKETGQRGGFFTFKHHESWS